MTTIFPKNRRGIIHKNLFLIGFLMRSIKTTKKAANENNIAINRKLFGAIIPKLQWLIFNTDPANPKTKPIIATGKIMLFGNKSGYIFMWLI